VDLVAGTPARLDDGRLVMAADRDGARRLLVDGQPVTDLGLQVRSVVHAGDDEVVFLANRLDTPTDVHVWRWRAGSDPERVTSEPGVHSAVVGGGTVVVRSAGLGHDGTRTAVIGGVEIASYAEAPLVRPNVTLLRCGERALATAVLLPPDVAAGARLPVLLDPYGGPHAQRVQAARAQYLTSQWFADQGFAVVVIDGRGTPGRGSAWERAVHLDLATPVLEDQVDGLLAAAEADPRLDLSRVAIRGWSFGGYLAALAVLRRPDVFHAAVAGAPVTEWRLYDTHYTERYLGDPSDDAEPYDRSSLLGEAGRLERPLLLVHGLADDNVVAAHTLRLSSALLAVGRAHQVLPLSGVTHMTPQEVVAENLLLLQLAFLREALGLDR
jgi:dipeptidyl-peptidase 4